MFLQFEEGFNFENYIPELCDSPIPAILRGSNGIAAVVFDDVFDTSFLGYLFDYDEQVMSYYPISRLGGDYEFKCHVLIKLSRERGKFMVDYMEYFSSTRGWSEMVKMGKLLEPEREPDPE